jgi:hypothetical protein
MRKHIHAADECQAAVNHDDLLVFLPEIDRARDLCRQFLVTRLQMSGDLAGWQDYYVYPNATVLGFPKVREQLL